MSIAIGAAIAVMTGIGAGLGIGYATAKSSEAIARQPEASGQISKNLILGCALAEATAIYGLPDRYPADFHELIGVRSNDPQSKCTDHLGVC